jgi:hypothetical protein
MKLDLCNRNCAATPSAENERLIDPNESVTSRLPIKPVQEAQAAWNLYWIKRLFGRRLK